MRTALAGLHLEGNGGSWNPGAGGDGWSGGGGGCGGDCGCGGSCGGDCGCKGGGGACGGKPWNGGGGSGGGAGQLPLIPDYDGVLWDGSRIHATHDTRPFGETDAYGDGYDYWIAASIQAKCSIELICGELVGFFRYANRKVLPPANYSPRYFGAWHCELEVTSCRGSRMRYGVIGDGNATQAKPVMGSDGRTIDSRMGVRQRVPSAEERGPGGSHANPWLLTIEKWEFKCANWIGSEGSNGDACDITPIISRYPHINEDWAAIGPNCNSFAMWMVEELGLSADFPLFCPPKWIADANVLGREWGRAAIEWGRAVSRSMGFSW